MLALPFQDLKEGESEILGLDEVLSLAVLSVLTVVIRRGLFFSCHGSFRKKLCRLCIEPQYDRILSMVWISGRALHRKAKEGQAHALREGEHSPYMTMCSS